MSAAAGPSRVTIDDRDPQILYSGAWTVGTGTGGLEYNNTYQLSRVAGSTATLSFQGDFVEVYGSVRKRNNPVGTPSPISSYTLEDGSSVTFTPVETDSNHFRILFFEKRGLTNSNHTLVIKNLVQDDFYFLDYFVIGASGDTPSIGDTTGSTSNSSPSSISRSSLINVGAIVGAVIGTMAITLLAVLIGFYCWRRTRRRGKEAATADEETNYETEDNTQQRGQTSIPDLSSSRFGRSSTEIPTMTPYDATPVSAPLIRSSGKASRLSGNPLPYLLHRNQGEAQSLPTASRDSVEQHNSDLSYAAADPTYNAPPPYVIQR